MREASTSILIRVRSLDIQQPAADPPWAVFRHTDTQHYINYDYGMALHLHGHEITFPTEFLHGLYDGGHGAGLHDYWEQMWHDPLSAGGFLWDLSDEGVVRTIARGNWIRMEIMAGWHPGTLPGKRRKLLYDQRSMVTYSDSPSGDHPAFDGNLSIENRYFYTNTDRCHFKLAVDEDGQQPTGDISSPSILPGQQASLLSNLPTRLEVL